ncbi:MAG: 2-dehydropantoate 2-reductase N-terminal domain-containing protein, partial [Bermanella sp.]
MARILIVGCGDIGGALALKLAAQGHQVSGLKRQPSAELSAIR